MDDSGGLWGHVFAEYYDYVNPYRDRRDVGFFVAMAREAGGPVLELGCGTGRVLIPTAKAGAQIVGLDASTPMLAVCRKKLSHESSDVQGRVQLVQADMREFLLRRDFPLVTIPFRSFQHLLTVQDQLACLGRIHDHLRPGGLLVLDIFNPSLPRLVDERYLVEAEEEPPFSMPDGRRVVRQSRLVSRDLARQTLEVEFTYTVTCQDRREEKLKCLFPIRYFFRFEVEHLLARSGFLVEAVYGDYDRRAFGIKEPEEMIFVARQE